MRIYVWKFDSRMYAQENSKQETKKRQGCGTLEKSRTRRNGSVEQLKSKIEKLAMLVKYPRKPGCIWPKHQWIIVEKLPERIKGYPVAYHRPERLRRMDTLPPTPTPF